MAGIGVKLNNIYGKRTLTTNIIGMGYSTVMTIAPMLTVIGALCIMEHFLGFDERVVLLYSTVYLYILAPYSIAVQLCIIQVHVGYHL